MKKLKMLVMMLMLVPIMVVMTACKGNDGSGGEEKDEFTGGLHLDGDFSLTYQQYDLYNPLEFSNFALFFTSMRKGNNYYILVESVTSYNHAMYMADEVPNGWLPYVKDYEENLANGTWQLKDGWVISRNTQSEAWVIDVNEINFEAIFENYEPWSYNYRLSQELRLRGGHVIVKENTGIPALYERYNIMPNSLSPEGLTDWLITTHALRYYYYIYPHLKSTITDETETILGIDCVIYKYLNMTKWIDHETGLILKETIELNSPNVMDGVVTCIEFLRGDDVPMPPMFDTFIKSE